MDQGRPLPPLYLFTALACMVLLTLFAPVYQLISYPWNAAGLIPLAAGLALNYAAGKLFIRSGSTFSPFEDSRVLVTSGVYKYSRNPMYLGMVLTLTGAAVLLGTLSPYIVIPAFAVTMDRLFIVAEEQMLERRFGEKWRQYRASVRRWL